MEACIVRWALVIVKLRADTFRVFKARENHGNNRNAI